MSDLTRFISRVEGGKLRSVVVTGSLNPQPDADVPARLLALNVDFYEADGSVYQIRSYGVDQLELIGKRVSDWVLHGILE